jgi:hypothetical protein
MKVEFELRLRDMMSGVLPKVAATARNVFGQVDRSILGTQKGLNELGQRVKLNVDSSGITQAQRDVERLKSSMNEMPGAGGRGGRGMAGGVFLGGMAMQGAMMAGREVKEVGSAVFNNGIELENMKVGLQTFVGKRADAVVEQVLKQAFYTPFTTQSLLPIEMGFIATGMNEKRANRDMMNLANAVAATGGNSFILDRIGSDMMGGAAKGTIQGREIMELQRTGHINIASLIAKDKFSNMPIDQAMKKVEDMDISFTDFESALQKASDKGGMFAGALDRLSQTVGGKNSTIKDMWWNITAKMMESQNGPIKRIQDGIIRGLQDVPGIVAKLEPVMNTLFDDFDKIIPSLKIFGEGIWAVLKPIGQLAFSDGVINLFKVSAETLGNTLHSLAPAFEGLAIGIDAMADSTAYWMHLLGFGGKSKKDANGVPMQAETAYVWSDTTGMGASGYVADTARMRKMTDSISLRSPWGAKMFDSHKSLDSFNRSQTSLADQFGNPLALHTPSMKFRTENDKKKKTKADTTAADSASDAIVGGGKRVININFKNFAEHIDIHAATLKEGVQQTEAYFKEMFLRVLNSVPSGA